MTKIDFLMSVPFHSTHDIEVNEWTTADNDDPQIWFDQTLEPGWYRLTLQIETDGEPQVFFDHGAGFTEVLSVRPRPVGKGHLYRALVKLPFRTVRLRLDPTNMPGRYVLRSFVLERVTGIRLISCLAAYGAAMMLSDPLNFAARLPVYAKALRHPHFLRLADPAAHRQANVFASYRTWMEKKDFNEKRDGAKLRRKLGQLNTPPLISILMPVYNTPEPLLCAAIESVRRQIYGNWQLCIADDCSNEPHVRKILSSYAAQDGRILVKYRAQNGHISEATNSAFALASGEWIALLDHDDMLAPHALAEVALEIDRHPEAELIYSDEDKLDVKGRRYEPYFKPDFSRELFRSQNYLNHLTVHRARNVQAVGGWRSGYEGSQDYDLNLRIFERVDERRIRHIPKILYHWRAVEGSTASSGGEKSYAYDAGLRALREHASRMQLDVSVEPAPDVPFYRLRFAAPNPAPLVSLIIPTRDKVELLRGCVESILTKTTYAPYEIIVVDNGSTEAETLKYLGEIERQENVRVLFWDKPFNYSAINNFAVTEARGTIVGLINNDIEVITPEWLTEMVSWAAQEDIGCVGAKLYYPDDTVQHAGVILGIGGVAGHSHKYFPRSHHGYFGRLKLVQNFSAVTGACLLVKKKIYEEVGGLDSENLTVAFNDVDFCLEVRRAGYVNVWTPYAEAYHLESVSRGREDNPEKIARFSGETIFMKDKWELNDEYYSINLTKSHEDFSIDVTS